MFSVFVKKWREDAGLNQEEAAAKAHVVQSQWAKWESHSYGQPKRPTCEKIANALGVSPSVVLSAAGYDAGMVEAPARTDEVAQTMKLAQLIVSSEERVPEERRKEFRTMVRQLVETTASVMSAAA